MISSPSKRYVRAAGIGAVLALSFGCTTGGVNTITNRGLDYRPIVDTKYLDLIAFENDLRECKEYAAKIDVAGSAVAGALLGAAAGAAAGAATGAVYGDAGFGATAGTVTGSLAGTGGSVYSARRAQEQIIQRCLLGRGYNILY